MANKEIKVIAIPDDTRIIINYGYDDDSTNEDLSFGNVPKFAKVGQQIVVESRGIELKDPSTGENIGSYNPPIDYLVITDVRDKYSIARKIMKKEIKPSSIPPLIRESEKTRFEKLNVNPLDVKKIKPADSISVGDIVEFVN